jgi:hypothetical protein
MKSDAHFGTPPMASDFIGTGGGGGGAAGFPKKGNENPLDGAALTAFATGFLEIAMAETLLLNRMKMRAKKERIVIDPECTTRKAKAMSDSVAQVL